MNKIIQAFKKSFYVRAGLMTGGLLLLVAVFVIPLYGKTIQLSLLADKIYLENKAKQGMVISSGHSGQKLENIQKLLAKYQNMIPPRSELSNVLDKIASRAQANGLEVMSLKPLQDLPFTQDSGKVLKNSSEKVYEVLINMKANGKFLNAGKYLMDLEGAPYKVIIRKIEFKTFGADLKTNVEPDLQVEMILGILMKFSAQDISL